MAVVISGEVWGTVGYGGENGRRRRRHERAAPTRSRNFVLRPSSTPNQSNFWRAVEYNQPCYYEPQHHGAETNHPTFVHGKTLQTTRPWYLTAVNTTTTTPSQPTFLLVREHTLPRRNQRYGGIKDITVRHRTMINDCRFLPSSWVWEASTSIHSRSLCCVPVRCYVTRFGIHYRHNLYGTWYTY